MCLVAGSLLHSSLTLLGRMASDSQVYTTCREGDKRTRRRRSSDGVRLERLHQLKVSLAGYRGAISRVKGRLEVLIKEDLIDRGAVEYEKDSLCRTFVRYMNCCDEYKDNLNSEDEFETIRVDSEREAMYEMKLDLERRLNELLVSFAVDNTDQGLASRDQQELVKDKQSSYRSKEHERSTAFEYSNKDDGDLNLKENIRVKTSRVLGDFENQQSSIRDKKSAVKGSSDISTSQASADSAGLRKLKAELHKSQCLQRMEIERQERVIEQQMELVNLKQEMQNRQAELRNKRELLQLQCEIDQAKLEEDSQHSSLVNFGRSR